MSHAQRKRALIAAGAAAALLAWPHAGAAAPDARVYRIGWLASGPPLAEGPYNQFLQRARELGYIEGKNLAVDYRGFERAEQVQIAARELVRSKVDVIVAQAPAALVAAHGATRTIPIVALYIGDPVRMGIVKSLARPGGNVTGFTWDTGFELAGRRLQIIKEIVPSARRVAILWNRNNDAHPYYVKDFEASAGALGLSMLPLGVSGADELQGAFETMTRERASAVVLLSDPFTVRNREALTALLERFPIPSLWGIARWPLPGALVTFGPNVSDQGARAAEYVDRIFKGASPADLPFQQPTRFDLIVDLKVARALGLTPSRSLLIQADRVIE